MAIFQSLGSNPQPSQQQTPKTPSTARKVFRYTVMPEILPRIRGLGIHFGHFAYLLALVFSSARLIPQAHPVLNAANIGRFGVRQVIAIAANNLTWDRKHIDQIGIFAAIIIGIIMIVIQAGLIAIMALIGGEAQANPGTFFAIPNESTDLSLIMFSQVFGDLSGFWGTGVTAPGSKTPVHDAIHAMLSMYSQAMMVIAVIIVLYYILTVIGEAAKTGTPFGQRFNSLWAPIRLVVALGLLVPLGSGLNAAQYVTLWTAKMGSGLGAQAWEIMATELIADNTTYYVEGGNAAWVYGLTENIFLAEACAQLFNKNNDGANPITSSFVRNKDPNTGDVSYARYWQSDDPNLDGRCGSVTISMKGQIDTTATPDTSTTVYLVDKSIVPIDDLFDASVSAVNSIYAAILPLATAFADANIPGSSGVNGTDNLPGMDMQLEAIADAHKVTLDTAIEAAYSTNIDIQFDEILQNNIDRGFLSAGLWYIKIGQTIQSVETPRNEMIPTSSTAASTDTETPQGQTWWEWFRGSNQAVFSQLKRAEEEVKRMQTPAAAATATPTTTSASYDACGAGFGYSDGDFMGGFKCLIYTMITPDSLLRLRTEPGIDPMTSLITAGSEIITRAINFTVVGFIAIAAGATLEKISGSLSKIPGLGTIGGAAIGIIGGAMSAAGHVAIIIGFAGFAAGLILFYLLPLFPFIYFFFGVISWLLEIIEAVIAMPLWALAHLRIDGDGMPGQAAINGYHLLLAILLRPALIIVALALGYVAFGAAIFLLQSLFDPLIGIVNNDRMYGFDLLIYTVIYAYLCYSLALMCFKMVDSVPSQILRWLGSGAQTFSDQNPNDPVQASTGAMIAAAGLANQGISGMSGAATNLGNKIGGNNPEDGTQHTGLNKFLNDRYGGNSNGPDANAGPSGGGPSGPSPSGGTPSPNAGLLGGGNGSGGASGSDSSNGGGSGPQNPHDPNSSMGRMWEGARDPNRSPEERQSFQNRYDKGKDRGDK